MVAQLLSYYLAVDDTRCFSSAFFGVLIYYVIMFVAYKVNDIDIFECYNFRLGVRICLKKTIFLLEIFTQI